MPVEDSEEANLWPFDVQMRLILRFQDIENDADPILVVISDNPLVGVGSIRFNNTALLLAGFSGFVILKLDGSWVKLYRVVSEKESLYLHELDVGIFGLVTGERSRDLEAL